MARVHPDLTAIRAVDACGGTYTPEETASGWAEGHTTALCDAMKAVVDADALTAELLQALTQALWHIGSDEDRIAMDEGDRWQTSTIEAAAMARAAIAKATGADQ